MAVYFFPTFSSSWLLSVHKKSLHETVYEPFSTVPDQRLSKRLLPIFLAMPMLDLLSVTAKKINKRYIWNLFFLRWRYERSNKWNILFVSLILMLRICSVKWNLPKFDPCLPIIHGSGESPGSGKKLPTGTKKSLWSGSPTFVLRGLCILVKSLVSLLKYP